MELNHFFIEAAALDRTYYQGPTYDKGDEHVNQRFFSFKTDGKLALGVTCAVSFTVDRPAKTVWPVIRDFNVWQNEYKHYYSGVAGDLQGKTFHLNIEADQPGPYYYEVVKAIPEYLIVLNQPVPADGSAGGLPGLGGLSPGFHVFLLNEHVGKTTISIFMEHASIAPSQDVDVALRPWREVVTTQWMPKWENGFIKTVKRLIAERKQ